MGSDGGPAARQELSTTGDDTICFICAYHAERRKMEKGTEAGGGGGSEGRGIELPVHSPDRSPPILLLPRSSLPHSRARFKKKKGF
mmetsp:Transcript_2866/g.6546  ORF Transcript_2866/g.6546 Transcript_2866/m.6546 type:complete len:86 (+) Transcript_2866:509-766(+)